MEKRFDFKKIQMFADELERMKRRVARIHQSVAALSHELDWEVAAKNQINTAIQRVQSDLEAISHNIKSHSNYIWDVRYSFNQLEKEICSLIDGLDNNGVLTPANRTLWGSTVINRIIPESARLIGIPLPELSEWKQQGIEYGQIMDKEDRIIEPWLQKEVLE